MFDKLHHVTGLLCWIWVMGTICMSAPQLSAFSFKSSINSGFPAGLEYCANCGNHYTTMDDLVSHEKENCPNYLWVRVIMWISSTQKVLGK